MRHSNSVIFSSESTDLLLTDRIIMRYYGLHQSQLKPEERIYQKSYLRLGKMVLAKLSPSPLQECQDIWHRTLIALLTSLKFLELGISGRSQYSLKVKLSVLTKLMMKKYFKYSLPELLKELNTPKNCRLMFLRHCRHTFILDSSLSVRDLVMKIIATNCTYITMSLNSSQLMELHTKYLK